MNTRRRRQRCHTPDKSAYRFEGEATRAAKDATAVYGHAIEPYECSSCGFWHLTRVKP